MSDINTSKVDGNTISASEFNQLAEIDNLISTSGQTPSLTNLEQISTGSARYSSAGQFYTDSGTANAYVLSPVSPFKSPVSATAGEGYFNGMVVIYRAGNPNTGPSTVNVNGAGVKNIKKADGTTDPDRGQISTTEDIVLRYNGTSFIIVDKRSNTPAFQAFKSSNQTVTAGVITKITFGTENLDTHNYYDNAINHRFTPLVAGWYFINASVKFVDATITAQGAFLYIYRNGSLLQSSTMPYFDNGDAVISVSNMIYFNGSTDYVEIFGQTGGTGATTIGGSGVQETCFSGFKLNI
jgi:hypothetical protein